MKETNSKRTIKDRCERSYGNKGKIIALWVLFRCLRVNAKKKIPARRVKNYGRKELMIDGLYSHKFDLRILKE